MKHPPLSSRLLACCSFIRPGDRVADIGCDHGYMGIHLLQQGIACSVIAADINRQPLESAMRNAHKYGITDKMSFYLSDGACKIPQDFDTLVCAGMGADTIISILESSPWLKSKQYRLILQCQSRRPALRKYLYDQGYCIHAETLAQDGKFLYPVMEVVYCPSAPLTPGSCHISPALLRSGSPLLPAFYARVLDGIKTTMAGLAHADSNKTSYYNAVFKELLEMEDTVYGNRR